MPSWSGLKRSAYLHRHSQSPLSPGIPHVLRSGCRWHSTTQDESQDGHKASRLTDNEFLDFVLESTDPEREPWRHDKEAAPLRTRAPTQHPAATNKASDRRDRSRISRSGRHRLEPVASRLQTNLSGNVTNSTYTAGPRSLPSLVGHLKPAVEENAKRSGRIRWIGLRTQERPSVDVSSAWTRNWARINAKYDAAMKSDSDPSREIEIDVDERTAEWAQAILDEIDSQAQPEVGMVDMSEFQDRYGERSRGIWREVTLWLLANRKDRVVDFLLATHTGPFYPPMNWVADSLYHLALHYSSVKSPDQQQQIRKLVDGFSTLSSRSMTSERMEMRNCFFRRVLPFCTFAEVSEIYRVIKVNKVDVRAHTLHHISRFFAENDHLEQGIDALLEARARGSKVNGYPFRSNCTTLLRHAVRHPAGQRIGLRLVDNLLRMGVYLDKQLRGVMMLNAVDCGDMDTALAIYRSILAHGIKPDAQTYGILLKGCRNNLSDTTTLTQVIDEAIRETDVRSNPILATQILHCLCLHHMQQKAKFSTIADVYAQLFDKSPLETLGINMRTQHEALAHVDKPLTPSDYDFAIMLSAYFTDASVAEAKRVYDVWRELVRRGERPFASLAATPFLSNIFLYKLISERTSLLSAAQVVKDMQANLPPTAGVQQSPPDIYTWSILVNGFTRHRQTKHASRIVAKMQELGIQPNEVTWTTLLSGFASEQDIDGALDTLRGLEEANVVYDNWIYRGLSRLSERNRAKLKAEMDRRRTLQRMDFVSDMKDGLTQKIAGLTLAGPPPVESGRVTQA